MRRQLQLVGGRRGSPAGPRGVILVITVLLVGLLLVMGMTMINLASSDYQVANNESRSIQSLYNADAGIEEAKMRVSPNAPGGVYDATSNPSGKGIPIGTATNWRAYILTSGYTQADIQNGLDPTHGKAAPDYASNESTSNYAFFSSVQTGGNAIQWGWARIQHKMDGSNIVYQNVLTGADTTNASQVVGGTTVYNPPILVVTAEGIQGPVRRQIQVQYQPIVSTTTSTTTNEVVTDPFSNAVHGRGTIELWGSASTDSYDSRNGAYNVGGNRGANGDISTDSNAAGAVSVASGSTVNGDVAIGPGGSTATAIANSGTITGTLSVETTAWNLPPATIPAGVTNSGDLTLSGNRTVTLSEGTYWYSSIKITGNAQLRTTGAVKIYVTGDVDIGGNGTATAGNLPPNLLIYGTATCTSVDIHGNGEFYGAVYAPNAAIRVHGNGAVYGSLTGNSAQVYGSTAAFHYDEALGNLGRTVTTNTTTSTTYTTTGYTRYSWREIAF